MHLPWVVCTAGLEWAGQILGHPNLTQCRHASTSTQVADVLPQWRYHAQMGTASLLHILA